MALLAREASPEEKFNVLYRYKTQHCTSYSWWVVDRSSRRLPGNWLSTKLEFMKNVSQILLFYTVPCSLGIIRNRRRDRQAVVQGTGRKRRGTVAVALQFIDVVQRCKMSSLLLMD